MDGGRGAQQFSLPAFSASGPGGAWALLLFHPSGAAGRQEWQDWCGGPGSEEPGDRQGVGKEGISLLDGSSGNQGLTNLLLESAQTPTRREQSVKPRLSFLLATANCRLPRHI